MSRYECAMEWVCGAKELLLSMQKEEMKISEKSGHQDIVTQCDREIERYLREKILDKFPMDRIVGEEFSEKKAAEGPQPSEAVWYLDPIDGTTNFVNEHCNYAISVGCAIDGAMVFGIVLDVENDRCYSACRGRGAWVNNSRLHTSDRIEIRNMLLTCPSVPDLILEKHEKQNAFSRLARDVRAVRSLGSVALELCQIACGRADICVTVKSSPWDHNAARLILQEAGGDIRGLDGRHLAYDKETSFIAGNSADTVEHIIREYFI